MNIRPPSVSPQVQVTTTQEEEADYGVPSYEGPWTTRDGDAICGASSAAPVDNSAQMRGSIVSVRVATSNSAESPVYAIKELDDAVVIYLGVVSADRPGLAVISEAEVTVDLKAYKNNNKPVMVADGDGNVYDVLPPVIVFGG